MLQYKMSQIGRRFELEGIKLALITVIRSRLSDCLTHAGTASKWLKL